MDEIDKTQIGLERIRETIRIRAELFPRPAHANILSALHYAARYLHDVFEDFEKGRAIFDENNYVVALGCRSLLDFLSSEPPPEPINQLAKILDDREKPERERWDAFHKIERIRRQTDKRRFRDVVEGCVNLVASYLKNIEKFPG